MFPRQPANTVGLVFDSHQQLLVPVLDAALLLTHRCISHVTWWPQSVGRLWMPKDGLVPLWMEG